MGKAMIVYKVYPEEEVNLNELEEKIRKIEKVTEIKREPIAFGLELLRVAMVMDDKKEKPEVYEKQLRALPEVRNIETESMNLIS
jgi:translation elongation factor aEF-1 beta